MVRLDSTSDIQAIIIKKYKLINNYRMVLV